jgi:superfamily I DNA and/or RNA helicase
VLMQLLKSGYNHISGIGIITPYDAQRRKIRNEVNSQAKVSLKTFFKLDCRYIELSVPHSKIERSYFSKNMRLLCPNS